MTASWQDPDLEVWEAHSRCQQEENWHAEVPIVQTVEPLTQVGWCQLGAHGEEQEINERKEQSGRVVQTLHPITC